MEFNSDEEKIKKVEKALDDEKERDYYTIEWPAVTRNFQFGTYVHEILEKYLGTKK